jgi:hypothetical protein
MKPLVPVLLFANAAILIACGSNGSGADSTAIAPYVSANATAASGGGSTPTCVTAADVKAALGFDVRELTNGMKHYGPLWSCGFAAADESALPGVTVQFSVEPGSEADKRFEEMRSTVTMARGTSEAPDPVALGDRGMAHRTASRTMAAAVANGQLFSVDLHYGAPKAFGDKQAGVVTLRRKLLGA